LRLFSQADFQGRPAQTLPEILRSDLAQVLLELKASGVEDLASFPWFEAPTEKMLTPALELLHLLGAFSDQSSTNPLSDLGRRMAELPLHPRLSRILLEAERLSVLDPVATLVACLSEGEGDALDILELLHQRPTDKVARARRQFLSYFSRIPGGNAKGDVEASVARSLLCGFPDRVAKRRVAANRIGAAQNSSVARELDLLFSFGGSGTVRNQGSIAEHELFIVLDVEEKQTQWQQRVQVHVHCLCPIEEEWLIDLEPTLLREEDLLVWEDPPGRVLQSSRWCYGTLTLSESTRPAAPSPEASALLLREGLGLDAKLMESPEWRPREILESLKSVEGIEELRSLMVRIELLQRYFPQLSLVSEGEGVFRSFFLKIIESCGSRKDLSKLNFVERTLELMNPELRYLLEKEAPTKIALGSGRKISLHYDWDKDPWVESRLQDFFGMKHFPALMGGRLKVTIHFLAPNQRALQVTQDLSGFWDKAYPELRKQLSRRYPRHAWPENPRDAKPPAPRPKRP